MTIRMLQAWNGYPQQAIVTLSGPEETRLVGLGLATTGLDGAAENLFPVMASKNVTGVNTISAGGGITAGTLQSGVWANPPSIFRLLCNGTGTITLDSKDAAGVITTGVFSVTLSGAVNQIEFPFCGDSAVQIRATLTGTVSAQVI